MIRPQEQVMPAFAWQKTAFGARFMQNKPFFPARKAVEMIWLCEDINQPPAIFDRPRPACSALPRVSFKGAARSRSSPGNIRA